MENLRDFMDYILGLDVGIGSVGWAVIRNEKIKRIEDFGVRLFDSGEDTGKKERNSQKRRAYRSIRRLNRRKSHRKWRLKAHFENIGLAKISDIEKYFETASNNIIELRCRAIDEKISPEELAACLINICNRRGYKDFYDNMSDDTAEIDDETAESRKAVGITQNIMNAGGYRTVAEMIYKDLAFNVENSEFKKYRNNGYTEEKIIFSRQMFYDEVLTILKKQSEYYPQLNQNNIDYIMNVIFSQRDFEDGPGNTDDKYRKYTGFLDSLGYCTFYKDEKRGSRFTLLADIFSLSNTLSQLVYIDSVTGEYGLPPELAKKMIDFAISNGKIGKTDIAKLSKKYGIIINSADAKEISKCFIFSKSLKQDFESCGYNWDELAENYLDENSLLNRIGIFLSENITPKRRKEKIIKEFPELNDEIISKLISKKPKGTTNVCYKFMRDSIEAFLCGESYGSFQAQFNKELEKTGSKNRRFKKLPAFDNDCEFIDNPVVLRAINETRKIINAVIEKYGSPSAINIEIGSELNRSFKNRAKDDTEQSKKHKDNENAKKVISEICNIKAADVTAGMIERYKLGEEQGWHSMYSNREITDENKKEAILNRNHIFEVDHIVPFSLILDNTLSNKALVYFNENQAKGQRTPLMYLNGEAAKIYTGNVNRIYGKKKEFKRKYQYLMLKNLSDSELLKEWKSRNLNDMRYISKYLVNYLKNNLEFAESSNKSFYRQKVYGVKSAITSKLRRQWLNPETWGCKDKSELKKVTCLDHAVDAIVIANCIPAYVEMTALNQKLKDIFYSSGKVETKEYTDTLEASVEMLGKYYGVPKELARKMLLYKKTVPSLVPNLRDEVDIRVCDCSMDRYFAQKICNTCGKSAEILTDEQIIENFRKKCMEYYSYDTQFAESLEMPLFSLKQDKKLNKQMFADKPISIKSIDRTDCQISRKKILDLKKKEISKVYTNDKKLIEYLETLMADLKEEDTVGSVPDIAVNGGIIYNGRPVYKLKLKSKAPERYFTKIISDNNNSIFDNRKYYCLEVYMTKKDKTGICGIPYSDIVKKNGKLYLRNDYKYPDDYALHSMYLFPGDFIRLNKGKEIVEGYYRSIKDINQGRINITKYNNSQNDICIIGGKTSVEKISIDISGKKGGVVKKCGEPLSLIREKT